MQNVINPTISIHQPGPIEPLTIIGEKSFILIKNKQIQGETIGIRKMFKANINWVEHNGWWVWRWIGREQTSRGE